MHVAPFPQHVEQFVRDETLVPDDVGLAGFVEVEGGGL